METSDDGAVHEVISISGTAELSDEEDAASPEEGAGTEEAPEA